MPNGNSEGKVSGTTQTQMKNCRMCLAHFYTALRLGRHRLWHDWRSFGFGRTSVALHGSLQKLKGLDTCYGAAGMSQTREQQRSTISEVAADWHELMTPQRTVPPPIARAKAVHLFTIK